MNSTELASWLRTSAYIGDAAQYPDQTDAVLFDEMTHKLWSVYGDLIVKARAGYWLKDIVTNTTVGRQKYRIPSRAVVGGLESVEIAGSTSGAFYTLTEISPTDMQDWEGPNNAPVQGVPEAYCVFGDQVLLFPTPNIVLPLRLNYYVRPSKLVTQQSTTIGGGTVRGLIGAGGINVAARTVTVNVLPFDMSLAVPASISTGLQRIDIVHPNGWYELPIVGATQTIAGLVITLTDSQDMSEIEVGDFVRAAEQTDWPCLPEDFHRSLADVAAIKVAVELGLREKNDDLAQNVENDLVRFRSLLLPRVKSEPKQTPVSLKSRDYYGGW